MSATSKTIMAVFTFLYVLPRYVLPFTFFQPINE